MKDRYTGDRLTMSENRLCVHPDQSQEVEDLFRASNISYMIGKHGFRFNGVVCVIFRFGNDADLDRIQKELDSGNATR